MDAPYVKTDAATTTSWSGEEDKKTRDDPKYSPESDTDED